MTMSANSQGRLLLVWTSLLTDDSSGTAILLDDLTYQELAALADRAKLLLELATERLEGNAR